LRAADPARFQATRLRWLGNDPVSFAAVYRMLVGLDLLQTIPRITTPALFIGCTLDAVRPPDGVAAVAKLCPGARFAAVESGHFLAIQNPEALLALLLPFLADWPAGAVGA
jgi:3-oxoadipate enol-lactonase